MAVIAHVVLENVTKDQYDAVRKECGWLEDVPAGGLAHMSFWDGDVCHNFDSWESEQAFADFGEQRLGPALAKVGVEAEPQVTFHEAHEVFLPKALTITAS